MENLQQETRKFDEEISNYSKQEIGSKFLD